MGLPLPVFLIAPRREEGEQVFRPFYAISDQGESGPREAFYMIRRQPRVVSSKQQRKGPPRLAALPARSMSSNQ